MAERRSPIKVPPRQPDEAPASPEQLQFIRQLVTGMSMSGFRFDYRKLGTDQAASVIDQLLKLRDASGVQTNTQAGGGCIGSLVRGTVRATVSLIVLVVVLAGVAVGGYLIYQKVNETPGADGQDPAVADAQEQGGSADADETDDREKSKIFDGLYVDDPPGNDDPTDPPTGPTFNNNPGAGTDPPTTGTNPPNVGPRVDPVVGAQLKQLENMLVHLSQYTRQVFDASIRSQSAEIMLKKLDGWPAAMDAIDKLDPALAERIRNVIQSFAAEELDGQAIRDEVDAIRQKLDGLSQGS